MASKSAPARVNAVSQQALVHVVEWATVVTDPNDAPATTGTIRFHAVTGNPFADGDLVTVTISKP